MLQNRLLPSSFSPRQRWVIGANVVLSIAALVAIVVMVNYVAARHFQRFQVHAHGATQLSPLTGRVLDSVTNQVDVFVLYARNPPTHVSSLLDLYRLRSRNIKVQYVDYLRYRDRAKMIEDEFKLESGQSSDRIIFAAKGQHRVVYTADLADFDISGVLHGGEIKRTGFRGEQFFTSAIFSLVDPNPRIAYYLTGHGVHDPTQRGAQDGYSEFIQILLENNIKVLPHSSRDEVPSDCQLLIIAGPQTAFLPTDIEHISDYLNNGGRMLLLFRTPPGPLTGLERLVADWGIEVGNNFVVDPKQQKAGEENLLIVDEFGSHPIVDPLRRSALALFRPRSISPRPAISLSASTPKAVELATTSEGGESHVLDGANRVRTTATGKIPVAVAAEKETIQGIRTDRGATRIVVVGNSFFLGNALIQMEGNRDFARNVINWLVSRELLLEGIGPQPIQEYRITLTRAEMQLLLWLFLGAAPGTAFAVGGIVWFRRRS